jgi:hypothetical protein
VHRFGIELKLHRAALVNGGEEQFSGDPRFLLGVETPQAAFSPGCDKETRARRQDAGDEQKFQADRKAEKSGKPVQHLRYQWRVIHGYGSGAAVRHNDTVFRSGRQGQYGPLPPTAGMPAAQRRARNGAGRVLFGILAPSL